MLVSFPGHCFDVSPFLIDIVHAVSYSLLLLNTDLHVAELSTRMSRSQFVRNTLTAIQMQLQPISAARLSTSDLTYDDCSSSVRGPGSDETEVTMSRSKRSNSITSWNSVSPEAVMSLSIGLQSNQSSSLAHLPNGSSPSIQVSTEYVHGRAWENDMESLLKVGFVIFMSQRTSFTSFDNRKSTMLSSISRFFNQ